MQQPPSESGKRPESAFARRSAAGDLPANISSSEGSDQSERGGDAGKGPRQSFRRNTHARQTPQGPHRRYKSMPGGGFAPAPLPPYQPGSARAAGPVDNTFNPHVPVYHPWVSGYDPQWSAYGMYVHSTVMSRRSDKPTRIIFIGNLCPSISKKHVIEAAGKFGGLRVVDASLREYWFGMFVSYWDTRHAEEAVAKLPEMLPGVGSDDVQKIPCMTFFILPPAVAEMENQGLLTVKIEDKVTTTMIRNLFSKFGDVKSVRSVNDDAKAVEFYDARAADAAMKEINSSAEHRALVKDVQIASIAAAAPTTTQQPEQQTTNMPPPAMTTTPPHLYTNSRVEESGSSDGDASPWPAPSAPYPVPWGQYPIHQQQHFGEMSPPLQRQHSAPAGYSDHHNGYSIRRHDAMWTGHYMGYPPH